MKKSLIFACLFMLSLSVLLAQVTYNEVEKNDTVAQVEAGSQPKIMTKNAILIGSVQKDNDQYDYWKLDESLEGNIKISIVSDANVATYGLLNQSDKTWVFRDIKEPQSTDLIPTKVYYLVARNTTNTKVAYTVTLYDEATLPVELSSFDAVLLNTNNVQLNWTTQTEANMVGYNIYRSNDDVQTNAIRVNNETIGATNTSSEHNYSFIDYGIEEGEYYYWLQSVESNNEIEMHGPVQVIYNINTDVPNPNYQYNHVLKGAYPNPFNPSTSIQYELACATDVQISIYNTKGQRVKTYNTSHNAEGTYSVTWNGEDENGKSVNSGVYFYTMTAGKTIQSKKMILVK
ncbi:MAG TPA: FlgD immunoglobulin-like domain containing protein [Candidatus Cloacimonadota bacterium]|nr:FlgD immunoglobulin-like domain containing protein [Candidatus Cloacimonadota bacterium]